jgi:hypothetical protein
VVASENGAHLVVDQCDEDDGPLAFVRALPRGLVRRVERRDSVRFAGATLATIDLVRTIKRRNPSATIVLNRGYDILPAIENSVDMVLAESLVTAWDFQNNRARMAPASQHRAESDMLKAAALRNPELRLLALEYWPPEDDAAIKNIYAKVRALGFAPYVATVALDRVVPEPR